MNPPGIAGVIDPNDSHNGLSARLWDFDDRSATTRLTGVSEVHVIPIAVESLINDAQTFMDFKSRNVTALLQLVIKTVADLNAMHMSRPQRPTRNSNSDGAEEGQQERVVTEPRLPVETFIELVTEHRSSDDVFSGAEKGVENYTVESRTFPAHKELLSQLVAGLNGEFVKHEHNKFFMHTGRDQPFAVRMMRLFIVSTNLQQTFSSKLASNLQQIINGNRERSTMSNSSAARIAKRSKGDKDAIVGEHEKWMCFERRDHWRLAVDTLFVTDMRARIPNAAYILDAVPLQDAANPFCPDNLFSIDNPHMCFYPLQNADSMFFDPHRYVTRSGNNMTFHFPHPENALRVGNLTTRDFCKKFLPQHQLRIEQAIAYDVLDKEDALPQFGAAVQQRPMVVDEPPPPPTNVHDQLASLLGGQPAADEQGELRRTRLANLAALAQGNTPSSAPSRRPPPPPVRREATLRSTSGMLVGENMVHADDMTSARLEWESRQQAFRTNPVFRISMNARAVTMRAVDAIRELPTTLTGERRRLHARRMLVEGQRSAFLLGWPALSSCQMETSPEVTGINMWLRDENRKPNGLIITKPGKLLDRTLSMFANQIALLMLQAENIELISFAHARWIVLLFASLDTLRIILPEETDYLRFNVLNVGPPQSSKSVLLFLLMQMSIRGTVQPVTSFTQKGLTKESGDTHGIKLLDEAPKEAFGMAPNDKGKGGQTRQGEQNDANAMLKMILTTGCMIHYYTAFSEAGVRHQRMVRHVFESSIFASTNAQLKDIEGGILSRFHVEETHVRQRDGATPSDLNMIREADRDNSSAFSRALTHQWSTLQALAMHVNLLIAAGVLPEPSLDVLHVLTPRVNAMLKERFDKRISSRDTRRITVFTRAVVIVNAIWNLYEHPRSICYGKTFEMKDLMLLCGYLYATVEMVQWVLGLLLPEYVQPKRTTVLKTMTEAFLDADDEDADLPDTERRPHTLNDVPMLKDFGGAFNCYGFHTKKKVGTSTPSFGQRAMQSTPFQPSAAASYGRPNSTSSMRSSSTSAVTGGAWRLDGNVASMDAMRSRINADRLLGENTRDERSAAMDTFADKYGYAYVFFFGDIFSIAERLHQFGQTHEQPLEKDEIVTVFKKLCATRTRQHPYLCRDGEYVPDKSQRGEHVYMAFSSTDKAVTFFHRSLFENLSTDTDIIAEACRFEYASPLPRLSAKSVSFNFPHLLRREHDAPKAGETLMVPGQRPEKQFELQTLSDTIADDDLQKRFAEINGRGKRKINTELDFFGLAMHFERCLLPLNRDYVEAFYMPEMMRGMDYMRDYVLDEGQLYPTEFARRFNESRGVDDQVQGFVDSSNNYVPLAAMQRAERGAPVEPQPQGPRRASEFIQDDLRDIADGVLQQADVSASISGPIPTTAYEISFAAS